MPPPLSMDDPAMDLPPTRESESETKEWHYDKKVAIAHAKTTEHDKKGAWIEQYRRGKRKALHGWSDQLSKSYSSCS